MQDKDFDKLFSSKFEDFEAEPSRMVWENIADELEDKKVARPWGTYLSIAAGIMIVFTVGWLFLQKDVHPGQKHHSYSNLVHRDIVKPATSATTALMKQPEPVLVDSGSENKTSTDRMASNGSRPHKSISPVNKVTVPVSNKVDDVVKESQPAVNANPPVIAQTTTMLNTPVVIPTVPDVQLSPKTIGAVAAISVEKPAVIVSTEKETEEPAKKRGIHNLGGLINVLVSKVDKRADKFIEFSDGEDDDAETTVTGVNVGPIKFKKQ